ncbi:hypothetical protein AADZ90_022100 [Aestuariibius sp. 2305UL40-4]|uniref:hypothetical protein n=1 Tax=Aestuariibius violaceus TaxID=3234132 RepID=UPI00345E9B9A
MLFLSGFGSSQEDGVRDLVKMQEEARIIECMAQGRKMLKKVTGQDFGYSLAKWHDFLINDKKASKSYMRPSTWRGVENAIMIELRNPDRERLESLAENEV